MKENHHTQRLIFFAIRLIDGVGRLKGPAEGFHTYLSLSPFYVLALVACEDSVWARSLGLMYSGYLPMGSPCPLLANLNLLS